MSRLAPVLAVLVLYTFASAQEKEEGFLPLFDGKTLNGWTPQDPALSEAFKVEDGAILTHGKFTHLFYSGTVNNAQFKNFELRFDFKMANKSNSGVFFHTKNPGPAGTDGKPKKVEQGYECQVCDDEFKDPKKTGSLYDIEDIKESPAKPNEWNTYIIRVEGRHIVLSVNGKVTVDYTEPVPPNRKKGREGRVVSSGTFALQAHDPGSKVWFRNIRVKLLPD